MKKYKAGSLLYKVNIYFYYYKKIKIDKYKNNRNFISIYLKQVFGYIVGWTHEFFSFLGYIVSCGYPTRITIPIREEIQLLMYGWAILSLNVNILPISFGAVKAIFH